MTKLAKDMTTKEKLLALADFLETKVEDRWFGLSTWATPGFDLPHMLRYHILSPWATQCFPDSGLWLETLSPDSSGHRNVGIIYSLGEMHHYSWDAIMKFFDLSIADARHLFYIGNYDYKEGTRINVIQRLREFANSEETE